VGYRAVVWRPFKGEVVRFGPRHAWWLSLPAANAVRLMQSHKL
jgi:hypothetical protein